MSGFTLPSVSLLSQSILSGIFVGALYGLMGLGLSLSWGLLRLINLAHFAFAFLAAYLCLQLTTTMHIDPLLTLLVIAPAFFVLGAALHWVMARFKVTPFNSLLLTFGLVGIIEAIIQTIWTADFRKLESHYGEHEVQGRRAVRAGAGADHAGAGGRHLGRGVGGAALHRPRQGDARRRRGRADRRRPSASTSNATRCCWPAPARRSPASPACAWR